MLVFTAILTSSFHCPPDALDQANYVSFIADLKKHHVTMHWKDKSNKPFGSLQRLRSHFSGQKKELLLAMNGGMYHDNRNPVGLYIENSKTISALNTAKGEGNFFLQPNGVFYINDNKRAFVRSTPEFKTDSSIVFATQSGPMLVINGKIHPQFQEHSKNLNIRNGIGVMPDGRILMAMSKKEVNLYTFASYFLKKGCQNALYLDGHVSRAYCPEQKWEQLDGEFGVMIAVTK
jgi:uncharacterized protein YigE (DUF2233 family)